MYFTAGTGCGCAVCHPGKTAWVCISAENGRSLILCSYVSSGILGDIELMLDEKTAATTVIAVSEFSYILATEHNGVFREYLTDAAQSIGVSYRHVFRIIRRLCEAGILEKTGTGLRILDRGQLQKKSGAREHCFFI